jgi:LPXTG-site transpeptidase (sortase) family protein
LSAKRRALLVGSALLIVAGLALLVLTAVQFFGVGPQISFEERAVEVTTDPAYLQSPLGTPTWARTPPSSNSAALPTRPTMFIPSLDVEVPIVAIERDGLTWNVDDLGALMGYLEGTSPPGGGNSVYAGHLTLSDQTPGPLAALDKIEIGAIIRVFDGAQMYTYEVVELRMVDADDLSITKQTEQPTLTLITCGRWSWLENQYLTRVVATARLVEVE